MQNNLSPKLRKFKSNLTKYGVVAVDIASRKAKEEAQTNHEYKDRTGNLTAATQIIPTSVNSGIITGGIQNSSEIAIYIHEGTGLHGDQNRAYPILPVKKKALAFQSVKGVAISGQSYVGENLVIVKKIMHPGIKPDPFISKAIRLKRAEFLQQIRKAVNLAAEKSF